MSIGDNPVSLLTIREHFAAMAMQGLISEEAVVGHAPDQVAYMAAAMADALLKELETKEEG